MLDQLADIAMKFWSVLAQMAPYLLFGFGVAGLMSVLLSPRTVERHLGGPGIGPVLKAALFGVPLPLCSCGVIPVSASLRRHGASRGATTSFLISTPQTGVDSFMVTFSLLGPIFMIFRPLFALLTGIVGGAVVNAVEGPDAADAPTDAPELDAVYNTQSRGRLYRAAHYGFVVLPRDIGKALLIGVTIAALISALAPDNFFADLVPPGIWQMLVLMVAGIPIYACATASVPLMASLILTGGVSPGAAFAFLMTGPATNAATIGTIWRVMGKRTAVVYLSVMVVGAIAGGLLLDTLVSTDNIRNKAQQFWMMPGSVKNVSAVVLLAMLAYAIGGPKVRALAARLARPGRLGRPGRPGRPGQKTPLPQGERMAAITLRVKGMTCSHCAASVERALAECEGVQSVEVHLTTGKAIVQGDAADPAQLRLAVEQIGYDVTDTTPSA